jgi:pantetheine-phosphate adenylyltransferase
MKKTEVPKEGIKALYPGSFDPITNGHLDILERSLGLFSEIKVVVAGSSRKNGLFEPKERVEIIQEVIHQRNDPAFEKKVKVDHWSGLIMEYARLNGYSAVIRGLRAASDFEYEFMMASMNKQINSGVETVFMMTSQDLYFVSSSMIKELFLYGGDISAYVPQEVVRQLQKKFPQ